MKFEHMPNNPQKEDMVLRGRGEEEKEVVFAREKNTEKVQEALKSIGAKAFDVSGNKLAEERIAVRAGIPNEEVSKILKMLNREGEGLSEKD